MRIVIVVVLANRAAVSG